MMKTGEHSDDQLVTKGMPPLPPLVVQGDGDPQSVLQKNGSSLRILWDLRYPRETGKVKDTQ